MKGKKKINYKKKGKVHIINFFKRSSHLKRRYFPTQEVGKKVIFPQYLRNLHDI